MAQTHTQMLRSGDSFGRWGGEEFLAVLPGADRKHALKTAERLRAATEDLALNWNGVPVKVTVSIGVAEFSPDDMVDSLYEKADGAVYRAEKDGRNRVRAPG